MILKIENRKYICTNINFQLLLLLFCSKEKLARKKKKLEKLDEKKGFMIYEICIFYLSR